MTSYRIDREPADHRAGVREKGSTVMAALSPTPQPGVPSTVPRRWLARNLRQAILHAVLLLLLFLTLYPALQMLIFSFKNPQQWQ